MPLPEWLESIVGNDDLWWVELFLLVALTLLASFFVGLLIGRLYKKAKRTRNPWDDALLGSINKPVQYFIWLVGLSWSAEIAGRRAVSSLLDFVSPVREICIILLLTWLLIRFIRRAEVNLLAPHFDREPLDETTVLAIGKLLRVSVLITAALIMMQSLGYSISGVLAFGGIGGIAVGFAAKDLLANFFGGLMIYLDRPFAVGDWVRSPDQDIEGVVENIGWRLTRIRRFDKRPLYIPNSTFTHISVENPSRMTHRRIYETVGIRYSDADKMAGIVEKSKQYLQSNPDIDSDLVIIVNFNSFASSSLNFFIYAYTKTTDWVEYHRVKQAVLLGVLDIILEAGAECAFPTSTLHIDSVPESMRHQQQVEEA